MEIGMLNFLVGIIGHCTEGRISLQCQILSGRLFQTLCLSQKVQTLHNPAVRTVRLEVDKQQIISFILSLINNFEYIWQTQLNRQKKSDQTVLFLEIFNFQVAKVTCHHKESTQLVVYTFRFSTQVTKVSFTHHCTSK